jgi:hypothetical protein
MHRVGRIFFEKNNFNCWYYFIYFRHFSILIFKSRWGRCLACPPAGAHALATDNVQHTISIINQPLSQTFRESLDERIYSRAKNPRRGTNNKKRTSTPLKLSLYYKLIDHLQVRTSCPIIKFPVLVEDVANGILTCNGIDKQMSRADNM